jgi:hypothetical protein
MKATVAWWNLNNSEQTIKSLRKYLKSEGVTPWEQVQDMRLKFWISDVTNNLWGAVMLWECDQLGTQPLPPNRATELIGYPPTLRFTFDVEATVEGHYCHQYLNKLGLAFEDIN